MSTSFRRRALLGIAAITAAGLGASPAFADARVAPSASFFSGGQGTANWSTATSNDTDPFSVRLAVPDTSSYAGVALVHIGASLPSAAPSFEFIETGSASGGSPRLVIASTDGCYATEYALAPYSGWMTANQWDLMGSCGYAYNAGWSGVQAAFADRSVASAYVVSDSYTGGHVDQVDNISYGEFTLSQPKDNANH